MTSLSYATNDFVSLETQVIVGSSLKQFSEQFRVCTHPNLHEFNKLTQKSHNTPRIRLGCGEIGKSRVAPLWPQSRYQF